MEYEAILVAQALERLYDDGTSHQRDHRSGYHRIGNWGEHRIETERECHFRRAVHSDFRPCGMRLLYKPQSPKKEQRIVVSNDSIEDGVVIYRIGIRSSTASNTSKEAWTIITPSKPTTDHLYRCAVMK